MAGTRYSHYKGIIQEDGKFPQIIHNLNQFTWYRDAKQRTLDNDSEPDNIEQLFSAVRFQLPYVAGKTSPAFLMAIGDGLNICNIYLTRLRTRDLFTGGIPTQESACWEIFSYLDIKREMGKRPYTNDHEYREIEMSLPTKFRQIFTTDIAPFLKGGDYPLECDRIYDVTPSCISFDKIKIIAENRKNRDEQKLKIIWSPDKRDGQEREIISLGNLEWSTRDFGAEFESKAFTFTDFINALNR